MNNEKPRLWTRNFVLIIVINFLVFMNHIMLLSTFPFYIESLGGSEALAGLAATLFSLVAVLCRPVVGWMLDNGKRRAILLIGLAGMLLMPLGYMFASVIFLAFVFRMVHGASLALSNTATATIASDVIPAPRFAEGMGMFGMATALATSCAPALGLYLMDSFSYTVLFACASGSVLIALILFAILKNPPIKAEKKPLNVSALFSRAAVPASVIALVFMLTFGALENFLAKYAVEAELPSGGLFFAIMAVMLLLVRVVLGKYADKKGEAMFVYTCNSAMLAAFLLLALAPNTVTFIIAAALAEAAYMWIFVFIFSNLWGNRLGHALAGKIIRPGQDNPFFITLMVSGCTVLVMCPTMSMVAALLFSVIPGRAPATELFAVWVGTVLKNFQMALLWNLFAAGPVTRLLFRSIFRRAPRA